MILFERYREEWVVQYYEYASSIPWVPIRAKRANHKLFQKVREARPNTARRRLRLIHAGRLLTPGTLLYVWLASLEEKQLGSTKRLILGGASGIADSQRRLKPKSTVGTTGSASDFKDDRGGVWIHCSIGAEVSDNETEEDRIQVSARSNVYFHAYVSHRLIYHHVWGLETAQLKPLRGFDRLTTAGFSEEDIANVRRQFHDSRPPGNTNGEDGALQQADEDGNMTRSKFSSNLTNRSFSV